MNLEELLNSKTPPKKEALTDEDITRLWIKYKGLLKKLERDEAFWMATNENIKRAYTKLDELVEERTIKLKAVNEQLQQELNIRKKAEQKLRESEEKYKLLSTVTTDYVYEWDLKTDILEWFGSIDEALGYKKGEIPRTIEAWVSKIHPEDQKKLKESVEHHRKSINIINEEYRMHHKDGKWLYWIDQGAPIVRDGLPIKWIGGCKDVTKRKDAEQKLLISEKRFREAYNRAEFYKDLFAHDINNILQSILSANEIIAILGNYETNQKMVRLIEIIKEQVNRGKKLVSNVRKLSQIEGQEIIIEKIEIFNILKKAVKFIHNSFHDKNLKIQIKTFSEQIYIKANELIEEVFENILINAVKHNNNPTIEINIKISKLAKEGNNYYKIEFIDNGVGIEDDRKTTIFQRADKSIHGMGLGLSLVKKIIQKYEGKVWVENIVKDDYSKGSNFIILIPEVIKDD